MLQDIQLLYRAIFKAISFLFCHLAIEYQPNTSAAIHLVVPSPFK